MTGPKPIGGIANNIVVGAAFKTMASRMRAIDPTAPRDAREIAASEAMTPLAIAHAGGIVLHDDPDDGGDR